MSLSKPDSNRRNAERSTGPRTIEGKAKAAQNARTHGLTAKRLIVPSAMQNEFLELYNSLLIQLQPEGALEHEVFTRLITAAWNLRRVDEAESKLFDGIHDPLTNPEHAAQLDRLARYRSQHERALYKATGELRTLQTNRAHAMAEPELDQVPISPLIGIRTLSKRVQPARPDDEANWLLKRIFPKSHPEPN